MAKYIDADVLERLLLGLGEDVICDGCCREVLDRLDKVHAADVEGKRMTGVWLEQDETPNVSSNKIYRCSVCGCADEQSPSAEVPYCWHCGSKMKKMFRGGGE